MQYKGTMFLAALLLVMLTVTGLMGTNSFGGGSSTEERNSVDIHKVGLYRTITELERKSHQASCKPEKFIMPTKTQNRQDLVYTNCEGKILRGQVDEKGYGTLVDEEGNTIEVRPQ